VSFPDHKHVRAQALRLPRDAEVHLPIATMRHLEASMAADDAAMLDAWGDDMELDFDAELGVDAMFTVDHDEMGAETGFIL